MKQQDDFSRLLKKRKKYRKKLDKTLKNLNRISTPQRLYLFAELPPKAKEWMINHGHMCFESKGTEKGMLKNSFKLNTGSMSIDLRVKGPKGAISEKSTFSGFPRISGSSFDLIRILNIPEILKEFRLDKNQPGQVIEMLGGGAISDENWDHLGGKGANMEFVVAYCAIQALNVKTCEGNTVPWFEPYE